MRDYIFIKKCVRSFIEVRKLCFDCVSAFICITAIEHLYPELVLKSELAKNFFSNLFPSLMKYVFGISRILCDLEMICF